MVAPKKVTTGRVPEVGAGVGDNQTPAAPRSRRDKLRRMFQVEPEPSAKPAADNPSLQQPPRSPDRLGTNRLLHDSHPARGNLRAFLQTRRDRLAQGMPANLSREVVELPPADVLQTEHGPLWRRELRYPASHVHGRIRVDSGRYFDRERLAKMAKSPSFTELAAEECLFLDTETTGLSGGAGTMVFAYGIAFYEGDELVLEQLFLRDFGEEPAMLHHIAKRLAEHPVPVTFVGKSYDRHRISARLAVHKIKAPILTDRHLDLYHVIRREFGKGWPDSRLHTAEERLLGLYRDDDLPGSEAPAAFLDWVRDRTGPVDRVLEHNRLDVLSLAALLGVVTLPVV
ncbi:MAG: hypothetical protein ACI89X_000962 [Planctomycetota bacterium]